MTKDKEKQFELMKKNLDLTDEQAKELMDYDNEVEHKTHTQFDLTDEQKKVAKKYTQAQRAVTAYGQKVTRERKADNTKRDIIEIINKALNDNGYIANVENIEKIIMLYDADNNEYKLNLTKSRKKKGD